MSRLTCSFFIYYYLYYSYIYRIFCSYTIAKSSSNITPSKKSIYPPSQEGTEKLKPTIKLKVDDGEIAVLPFIICLF